KDNFDELISMVSAIENQDYPQEIIEVICVDNGSTSSIEQNSPILSGVNIVVLSETNYLNSPYSARNRGIEQAKGEVLVFADANSMPESAWLKEGVHCLQQSG